MRYSLPADSCQSTVSIIGKTQFGITCYDTSAVFTNTVYPPPAPPSIALNIPNCTPYTVDLFASGSGSFFNWSNGQSGPHITTSGGGAFRVWMTDVNGCKSHSDIDVPKDPRAYLWIFPTGCYEFCDNTLPRTIVGPIEPFNFWDWLQNGTPVLSHTGSPAIATNVQNYNLNSAGFYNLNIGTLACPQVMSDTMFVTTKPCGSGNGCGTDVIFKYQEFIFKQPCNAYWQFVFNSSLPYSVNVVVTASTGVLSPSPTTYTVTPGSNILNVSYNPPAGWMGGTVTFTMTYTDPKTHVKYVCPLNIYIPPCKKGPSPRPGDGARMANGGTASTGLWLVPNPATNATRAEYTLNAGTRQGSVEVFDVTGRLMSRTTIDGKEVNGSVSIPLSDYVPGVYLVVLREEGRVTQQSRLTVTH